ncbi:hypothetical protein BH23GEM9_BH23GEM9_34460 [soil metagenome]
MSNTRTPGSRRHRSSVTIAALSVLAALIVFAAPASLAAQAVGPRETAVLSPQMAAPLRETLVPSPQVTADVAGDFLQARVATRSRWIEGAAAGFVIGAGVTWLVIHQGESTSLCDRDANQDAIGRNECLGITAAGGVVGAGIGALIGSRFGGSRTRDDAVNRLRVGLGSGGGVRLGVVHRH